MTRTEKDKRIEENKKKLALEISEEAVRLWKENPELEYVEVIKKARGVVENRRIH